MQSTNIELDTLLENLTKEFKRHTGNAELMKSTNTIVVYSQGQSLKVEVISRMPDVVNTKDFTYSLKLDDAEVVGPFVKSSIKDAQDSVYSLVISRLGDKVVNSLLSM